MTVTVLLFASYAEALGVRSVRVELPAPATVADVVSNVRGRPGAGLVPATPLVAVNERYAGLSTPIVDGDEVALIPPVAGG